jgi:hypothetical protein
MGRAEPWVQISFESPGDALGMARAPPRRKPREPLASDRLEGVTVSRRRVSRPAGLSGIDAGRGISAHVVALSASRLVQSGGLAMYELPNMILAWMLLLLRPRREAREL